MNNRFAYVVGEGRRKILDACAFGSRFKIYHVIYITLKREGTKRRDGKRERKREYILFFFFYRIRRLSHSFPLYILFFRVSPFLLYVSFTHSYENILSTIVFVWY